MIKTLYYGFEIHARKTFICAMDEKGKIWLADEIRTTGGEFIRVLKKLKAKKKVVIIEESSMTYWVCQIVKDFSDEVIPCDAKHNAWIYKDTQKGDRIDAYKLAVLGRLGELKEVYHPESDDRAEFKEIYLHYIRCKKDVVRAKNRIKDHLRKRGYVSEGSSVYNLEDKERYIKMIESKRRKSILKSLYRKLETSEIEKERVGRELAAMGSGYPEVRLLKTVPGVGPITANGFVAIIQEPNRFATKPSLWRYSSLSVTSRSSAGKKLGYEKLNRDGNPMLKDISRQIFKASMRMKDNGIKENFEETLLRTHNHTHARLTTQRKILWLMLTMWKRGEEYSENKIKGSK